MSLKTLCDQYEHVYDRGDGTYVALHRLMFHWTMLIGLIDDENGYDDRYCYDNEQLAMDAVAEWMERDWQGEPIAWHRHPKSGRRRERGDPATEYISP
jgi:hypothetical protein